MGKRVVKAKPQAPKLGDATAKRMKDKLTKLKGRKDDSEEIKSDDNEGTFDDNLAQIKKDTFFAAPAEDERAETAEEKRLRMTK